MSGCLSLSTGMSKCQDAAGCVQEQAFVHKYPVRDPSGWQDKALKYKPGCSSDAYDIAMGPLVSVIVFETFSPFAQAVVQARDVQLA
jgi:hypothetical protein